MVCLARAVAHDTTGVAAFSDPTAAALLPDGARKQLEEYRAVTTPQGLRAGFEHASLEVRAKMMVARTVAIDEAIREAATKQVVILGAGLDGRAWRMSELRETVVFEVDHPDSQREKRSRANTLEQIAGDVRFVPVDFERDDLDQALAAVGHDPTLPTTWIWEGVVMYLSLADIEATLSVVSRRSAPGSRLIILYHSPALFLTLVGILVRQLGEPLRSSQTAAEMEALLGRHGFRVLKDENMPTIGAAISPELVTGTKTVKHMRLVTAERL
jgi:methyltransferase (TIGR00027 family)